MATHLDLADAQFIGFKHGKWNYNGIIALVKSMGMSKAEWNKWKRDYPNILDQSDFNALDEYFNK